VEQLGGLLVIGAVLEATVQILRAIWDASTRNFNITMLVLLVLSLLFAIVGDHDWVGPLWSDLDGIIGQILTGLLFARAAQFVHDVYNKAS
jgi:hypothetical protein